LFGWPANGSGLACRTPGPLARPMIRTPPSVGKRFPVPNGPTRPAPKPESGFL
jgi:hypothetical protein